MYKTALTSLNKALTSLSSIRCISEIDDTTEYNAAKDLINQLNNKQNKELKLLIPKINKRVVNSLSELTAQPNDSTKLYEVIALATKSDGTRTVQGFNNRMRMYQMKNVKPVEFITPVTKIHGAAILLKLPDFQDSESQQIIMDFLAEPNKKHSNKSVIRKRITDNFIKVDLQGNIVQKPPEENLNDKPEENLNDNLELSFVERAKLKAKREALNIIDN